MTPSAFLVSWLSTFLVSLLLVAVSFTGGFAYFGYFSFETPSILAFDFLSFFLKTSILCRF